MPFTSRGRWSMQFMRIHFLPNNVVHGLAFFAQRCMFLFVSTISAEIIRSYFVHAMFPRRVVMKVGAQKVVIKTSFCHETCVWKGVGCGGLTVGGWVVGCGVGLRVGRGVQWHPLAPTHPPTGTMIDVRTTINAQAICLY